MSISKLIGSRVDQLDSTELDDQVFTLLKEQFTSAFKYIETTNWLTFWQLEVDALIKAALLSVLLLQNRPSTVGQSLLDLGVVEKNGTPLKRWKLLSIFLLLAGTNWFRERCLTRLLKLFLQDSTRAERYASVTDAVFRLAGVANFYAFLTQSRYPSLLYRLFGVTMHYSEAPNIRQVDYDTMSRDMIWTTFAEFLAFLLPIINSSRSRSFFRNTLRKLYGTAGATKGSLPTERKINDYRMCGVCSKLPSQPHEIGCRHVFCYYCITSNVLEDEGFECPQCGKAARGVKSVIPATVI